MLLAVMSVRHRYGLSVFCHSRHSITGHMVILIMDMRVVVQSKLLYMCFYLHVHVLTVSAYSTWHITLCCLYRDSWHYSVPLDGKLSLESLPDVGSGVSLMLCHSCSDRGVTCDAVMYCTDCKNLFCSRHVGVSCSMCPPA